MVCLTAAKKLVIECETLRLNFLYTYRASVASCPEDSPVTGFDNFSAQNQRRPSRSGHKSRIFPMPDRDIFLSYSTKDEAVARLALEKLEAAGHRCWFAPRDIPPGEFYAGKIIQALRASRFVLLFFSIHSNASEQIVREINFAVSQRLPMLVIRLDQTALSNDFECLIRINQWLDLTHVSFDVERVNQIVDRVQASFARSGPKSSTVKAPVAMTFSGFEILADSSGKPIELGRGSMGVTYRARQISMGGREVALKVIQPELSGDDNIRRRFLGEAQLAGETDRESVAATIVAPKREHCLPLMVFKITYPVVLKSVRVCESGL